MVPLNQRTVTTRCGDRLFSGGCWVSSLPVRVIVAVGKTECSSGPLPSSHRERV